QNGMATASAEQKDILWKWLKVQQETHRKLYPDKDKLLAKYGVTWRMFKVDSLGDAEAELLSPEDAKVIAEQQAQLKKDMEDWVKAKAVEMHKKLGQAAAQAKKMLADNGKLNPKNLKPLFSAFEEFQKVDIAGSSFQKAISDAKDKFLKNDHGVDFSDVA